MATKRKTQVVQGDDGEPIATEIIAQDIQAIADAMRKISSGRLKREAIVVLIQSRSGLPRRTIEIVLNNLETLAEQWLKPKR